MSEKDLIYTQFERYGFLTRFYWPNQHGRLEPLYMQSDFGDPMGWAFGSPNPVDAHRWTLLVGDINDARERQRIITDAGLTVEYRPLSAPGVWMPLANGFEPVDPDLPHDRRIIVPRVYPPRDVAALDRPWPGVEEFLKYRPVRKN